MSAIFDLQDLLQGSIRFSKLGVPLLQGRILQWKFECILCHKTSKSGGCHDTPGTLAYAGPVLHTYLFFLHGGQGPR